LTAATHHRHQLKHVQPQVAALTPATPVPSATGVKTKEAGEFPWIACSHTPPLLHQPHRGPYTTTPPSPPPPLPPASKDRQRDIPPSPRALTSSASEEARVSTLSRTAAACCADRINPPPVSGATATPSPLASTDATLSGRPASWSWSARREASSRAAAATLGSHALRPGVALPTAGDARYAMRGVSSPIGWELPELQAISSARGSATLAVHATASPQLNASENAHRL
jgi:hypothetical protein